MTSMWMLERADGTLLDFDKDNDPVFTETDQGFASADKELIETYRRDEGGHLVEMVPAKPKVPVSQEEAEMLRKAGAEGYSVGKTIVNFVNKAGLDTVICSNEKLLQHEDRLMRAYVNGYEIVEPMEYNVKVPHTTDSYYAKHSATGKLNTWDKYDDAQMRNSSVLFTMAEIKHYGLEDCEREEINTEDSDGVD